MRLLLSKILFPSVIIIIFIVGYFYPVIYQMRAALALFSGIILSQIFGNPYADFTKRWMSTLLTWSVIGLGFGINLMAIVEVGASGFGYTVLTIGFCVLLGLALGRILKNQRDASVLITFGTAICGGSAIAALAPTIRAEAHDISVALAIVFVLNSVALFVFPAIGHYLQLTQDQFGLWSALAIHDTSSVVGATMQYGPTALEVGTTVKLARALWIVPLTLIVGWVYNHFIFKKMANTSQQPLKKPWFILGFLLASAVVTWIPFMKTPGTYIRNFAEAGLVLTLFCIGANLSRTTLKTMGMRPFIQGFLLWLAMGSVTLLIV
jgi:uncharacterized integral membrane protein (TIGR00698 family)